MTELHAAGRAEARGGTVTRRSSLARLAVDGTATRTGALRARGPAAVLVLVLAVAVAADRVGAAGPDPGVVLAIDASRVVLSAHDPGADSAGAPGPSFPVTVGSPAHPTPRGRFRADALVLNPAWHPAPTAAAAGAKPLPPSSSGPMGIAKIPFAEGGEVALHGGAVPIVLGKPLSSGCVRARDVDLVRLIGWLERHGVLRLEDARDDGGEVRVPLLRPLWVLVR
jgi:lipoprotein-anchoring transpeptidase ErfK/SrfK